MSSDLLEFDSFYKAPADALPKPQPTQNNFSFFDSTATSSNQSWQTQNTNQPSPQPTKQNDDIWGDLSSFSSPVVTAQPAISQEDPWASFGISTKPTNSVKAGAKLSSSNYQGGNIYKSSANEPAPGIVRRSTLDLFNNNVMDMPEPKATYNSPIGSSNVQPQPPVSQSPVGGDILFDADEISDDDDFGEFESVPPPPSNPPPPTQSMNELFGSMALKPQPAKRPPNLLQTSPNLSTPLPYPQAPKSPSFRERNPFPTVGLATKPANLAKQVTTRTKNQDKPKSASPITAWPNYDDKPPKLAPYMDSPAIADDIDDDWGDFSDLPAESPALNTSKPTSGIEAEALAWDNVDRITEHIPPVEPNMPPPTNIPPPSIILTLFPQLFDLPQSSLFKAVANQPFSLKNRIMSDPSTINFLRAYLLIATVAAHIIAGRKFRWKRDTHLSQGMKIGPASGKGGMKLTGVDKAEISREDREAAEAVRVWKEQLGRLRSAVAAANSSLKDQTKHLVIPEIGEVMHVKNQEGALTAPKACIICGLKREERIAKVDVEVEDSFGEWWVEHWGHRLCRNFWQEHEGKLKFK